MRKWLAILAFLFTLWISFPIYAQGAETLTSVSVDIWPEYDQPAVLVIYHILLSPRTTLPATFNLRIPASAEVSAVAISDPAKGLLNAPYDRTVQGSWATLQITANLPGLQVEYYDTLDKNGPSRHIDYEWPGDYAVATFTISFQQPLGSTNLVTYPTLLHSDDQQDGFTYFASTPRSLPAGQSYTLTVDYQKSTDTLSTTGLPVQPAEPLNAATPGRITISGVLPWLFAVLGAILLVVGGLGGFYIFNGGDHHRMASRKHQAQPVAAVDDNLVYCPRCGKRAQSGDVFCRTCGTRIQKEE